MGLTVEEEIGRRSGQRIYFDPMWGNHGDQLIVMGSRRALEESRVTLVPDAISADCVFIKGGGYRTGSAWLPHITNLLARAPHVPVVILPSTFEDPSDIMQALHVHPSRSVLYARERTTFDLARTQLSDPMVEVRLDHDMAFRLERSEYLRDLVRRAMPSSVLIVERTDDETATGRRARSWGPTWAKSLLPAPLKTQVKRTVRRRLARTAPRSLFEELTLDRIHQLHPESASEKVVTGDISRDDFCSFEQFGAFIADATVVVTTRLHVAILALMLERKTYLVPGPYHKIRAVYEFSLNGSNTAHLLDLNDNLGPPSA